MFLFSTAVIGIVVITFLLIAVFFSIIGMQAIFVEPNMKVIFFYYLICIFQYFVECFDLRI